MTKEIKGKDPEYWINEKAEDGIEIGPDTTPALAMEAVSELRLCTLKSAAQAYLHARDAFERLMNEKGLNYDV